MNIKMNKVRFNNRKINIKIDKQIERYIYKQKDKEID